MVSPSGHFLKPKENKQQINQKFTFGDFLDNGIIFLNGLNTKEWTNSPIYWYTAKLRSVITKLVGYGRMEIYNNIDNCLWKETFKKFQPKTKLIKKAICMTLGSTEEKESSNLKLLPKCFRSSAWIMELHFCRKGARIDIIGNSFIDSNLEGMFGFVFMKKKFNRGMWERMGSRNFFYFFLKRF